MNNTTTLEYEYASSTVKVLSTLNLITIEIIGNLLLAIGGMTPWVESFILKSGAVIPRNETCPIN
jgi:hypothetical protein